MLLPSAGPLAGLPPLPDEGSPVSRARRVSDTVLQVLGDASTGEGGGNNRSDAVGHTMTLVPVGEDELAWAVYTVSGLDLSRPQQIKVQAVFEQPAGTAQLSYWLLLSDYSIGRWKLAQGPNPDRSFSGSTPVLLNSAIRRERLVSAKGQAEPTFSYIVLTRGNADNSSAEPYDQQPRVVISSGDTTVRPVTDSGYFATNAFFTQVSSVTKAGNSARRASAVGDVTLTWNHIYESAVNFPNEAQQYQVARRGPDDLDEPDLANLVIGGRLVGAQPQTYVDNIPADGGNNDPGVPRSAPGTIYTYYLRGRSAGGWSAFAAAPAPVQVDLPAVTGVTAADDIANETASIAVTWNPVAGVKGYQVLRDTDNDPAGATNVSGLVVGAATAVFQDSSAQPGIQYYYWLQPVGEGAILADIDDIDTVAEGAPLSTPDAGILSVVFTIVCTTVPAPPGTGTAAVPFVLQPQPQVYQFEAQDQAGNALPVLAADWLVVPPLSADFSATTAGRLENIWEFAGAFQISAHYEVGAFSWDGTAECEVSTILP